jgi:hypothetical protein
MAGGLIAAVVRQLESSKKAAVHVEEAARQPRLG